MKNYRIYDEDKVYICVDAIIVDESTTQAQYDYIVALAKNEGNSFILKRDLMFDYVSAKLASQIIDFLKNGRSVDMRMTWNDRKQKQALQAAVERFEEVYKKSINKIND